MSWRMEVESEDGSDAKYYTNLELLSEFFAHPLEPLNYMVIW